MTNAQGAEEGDVTKDEEFVHTVVYPDGDLQGMYTDKPSYGLTEDVKLYGNWAQAGGGGQKVQYMIRRVHGWKEDPAIVDAQVPPLTYTNTEAHWPVVHDTFSDPATLYEVDQIPPYGSFVENIAFDMSGMTAFTIEGWIRPSQVTGDEVVIAGQSGCIQGCASSATACCQAGGVYLGITTDGYLTGVVTTAAGARMQVTNATRLVEEKWYYVSMTYDGFKVAIFEARCEENTNDSSEAEVFAPTACACLGPCVTHSQPFVSPVDNVSQYDFRLGARSEAPGDLTGCFSGRMDRIRLWKRALCTQELQVLMSEGGTTCAAPTIQWNPTASSPALELFFDFEESYLTQIPGIGMTRAAVDSTPNARHGTVYNHGHPGMSGRPIADGRSLQLAHDQVIDAMFDEHEVVFDLSDFLNTSATWYQQIGATNLSGLYVIQAVLQNESGAYLPMDPANQQSNHFVAFVVRGDILPAANRIAAIVPTNIWQGYNSWPGADEGRVPVTFELVTARGLTVRYHEPATGTVGRKSRAQGRNSPYRASGGGGTSSYTGWHRPNWRASTRLTYHSQDGRQKIRNENAAHLDAKMVGWLSDVTGKGIVASPPIAGYEVDYFTDTDLHEDPCRILGYGVVVLMSHPEYVSLGMLVGLNQYADNGGSIVSVGGNALVWRNEAKTVSSQYLDEQLVPYSVANQVLEIKKWPETHMIGAWDGLSLMYPSTVVDGHNPNGMTGAWRFIEMAQVDPYPAGGVPGGTSTPSGMYSSYRDYILGTLPDHGGLQGDAVQFSNLCPKGYDLSKYGYWRLAGLSQADHWLLDGVHAGPVMADIRTMVSVGRIVGNETDRFVCHYDIHAQALLALECPFGITSTVHSWCPGFIVQPGGVVYNAPPWTIPWTFPFSKNGQVSILARGVDFHDDCNYSTLLWCAPMFDLVQSSDSNVAASSDGYSDQCYSQGLSPALPPGGVAEKVSHGNIVYYLHRGGGRVLAVSSIDSPNGLTAPISAINPLNTDLLEDGDQLRRIVKRALDCMLNPMCVDPLPFDSMAPVNCPPDNGQAFALQPFAPLPQLQFYLQNPICNGLGL